MWRRGHLEWHHLTAKIHENPPVDPNVINGTHTHTHTDRQGGDLISLLSFLESRLKRELERILPKKNLVFHS